MNDIDLLHTHGPQGPELSTAAAVEARARLTAEITARPAARRTRFTLPRLAVAGLALAAVAAVGVTVLPAVGGDGRPSGSTSPGPVRLVAAATPEFPYTLPGFGEPRFTADPGGPVAAVYGDRSTGGTVVLRREKEEPNIMFWDRTEVDGRSGRLIEDVGPDDEVAVVRLQWERNPGEWVTLAGNGRYATEAEMRRLAGTVTDQPQRLDFKITLGLAPDGWELGGFKSDATISILTYVDRFTDRQVSVVWYAEPPEDSGWEDSGWEGFETEREVRVLNRPARLIRTTDRWILVGTFADGAAYQLMAPRGFTEAQVMETARSMTVH